MLSELTASAATSSVALILLAAGASTRMGQAKQLLYFQGQTLLRRAAETAVATGCQPLMLVTGALHEELVAEIDDLPFLVTRNPDWAAGMGSSIRAGLAALEKAPQPPSAVLIMLCDQPLVTPALLLTMIKQQQASQAPVVASAYGGTLGVPAVFSADSLPALRQLGGRRVRGKLLLVMVILLVACRFRGAFLMWIRPPNMPLCWKMTWGSKLRRIQICQLNH
ncbi:NTP transferase domain-containing protein [Hymenobacter sp. HDW8]|uniref:nucleotidyltransferase family protein n=1 Tax=Hymenobacter sp. HDW8 TaxID=2714932 RepID=UPI0014083C17|nr:nucleotidyltransferase family protein [Hymenobacter sp. HDW8]QIL77730.1 nucleotidyltransferase family protein [Hymenobacter sp. HDW8]